MGIESNGGKQRWATYAAFWLALLVYAWTAAGHGYWLDSAEFTAVAVGLDIAHPPGHPLFALWSQPFLWLPVGALPFRVAIGQAVAAAIAVAALQRAMARALSFVGVASVRASLLSLVTCGFLATAYGFWFQAVRAEVYALQAMLVCIALERINVLACSQAPRDPRPFYQACLALGLGLANHHFIAVLAMPMLLLPLVQLVRVHGMRVVAGGLLAGALGLVCYAYLPLRALSEPPIDLGHPVTWRDFYWVISAQVYARRIGTHAIQPLSERYADLAVIVAANCSLAALPLSALASYALLRARRTWPLAVLWLGTALINLGGRAFLNPVRNNPDVLGYMMPGFAALYLLGLVFVGIVSTRTAGFRRVAVLAAAGLLTALGTLVDTGLPSDGSLAKFHATDAFDDLRRRALPPRALVVLTTPDVVFRHWEGEAVEQLRRDVVMLPLPFVGYGGVGHVLAARHPELSPLIARYQRDGQLSEGVLRALARERPVFVELDTTTTLPLWAFSTPEGLLYRVQPELPSEALLAQAGAQRDALEGRLTHVLADSFAEPETRRHLLWVRYVEALYFAWRGAFALSLRATDAGLSLAPRSPELNALRTALAHPTRPFDVRPFLVGSSK